MGTGMRVVEKRGGKRKRKQSYLVLRKMRHCVRTIIRFLKQKEEII